MAKSSSEEVEKARIYRRFYAAFQLRDICNEMPIHAVARKYDISRGVVQVLAQNCHLFAAGMIKFCERMQLGPLAGLLDHYSDRLRAGPYIVLFVVLLSVQLRYETEEPSTNTQTRCKIGFARLSKNHLHQKSNREDILGKRVQDGWSGGSGRSTGASSSSAPGKIPGQGLYLNL